MMTVSYLLTISYITTPIFIDNFLHNDPRIYLPFHIKMTPIFINNVMHNDPVPQAGPLLRACGVLARQDPGAAGSHCGARP